jgi:hypothetical protein
MVCSTVCQLFNMHHHQHWGIQGPGRPPAAEHSVSAADTQQQMLSVPAVEWGLLCGSGFAELEARLRTLQPVFVLAAHSLQHGDT